MAAGRQIGLCVSTNAALYRVEVLRDGAIVHFRKGRGKVFHAGACDWVAGLTRSDPMVEQVTRTVLRRFLDGSG